MLGGRGIDALDVERVEFQHRLREALGTCLRILDDQRNLGPAAATITAEHHPEEDRDQQRPADGEEQRAAIAQQQSDVLRGESKQGRHLNPSGCGR
ncbi:MAG: hypothetical protein IPP28_05620 [Xanthomonadales bacterium]|nr:hypothetical protein [Xanthomonadales bacterium]